MNTYKMTLEDSVDSMTFDLLEVPIVDKDVEGAVDNTTLDGNIFTDYLWLKKNYVQKWSIMCDDEYSRLRGFYTRQFDNASVPTYKLFYGENISQDQAISGDYILVDNTTDRNAPLTSFELLGDAEQTTYSGKNLLPNTLTTGTTNGLTYTVQSDGTIKLTGRATARVEPYLYNNSNAPLTFPAGTYKNTSSYPIILYAGGYNLFPAGGSLTFSETKSVTQAYFRVEYTGTTLNETYYPQIIASTTTNEDYEPYVGGTASPNPDYPQAINTVTGEQTVKIEGKNLFDGTYVNYAIGGASGDMWFPSSATRSAIISCQPSTTYTIKKYGGNRLNIADAPTMPSDNSTVNVLYSSNSAMEHTITTSATAHYLLVYVSNDSTEPEMQVELGSTATAYEPYQGQTLPVNLGKNLFSISQDTIISNTYLDNNATLTFDDLNSVSITATGTQGAQYLYRIITGLDSTQNYTFSFKGTKNVKGSTGLSYIRITTYGSNDGNTWTNLGVSGENNPTQGTTYSFTKTLTGYTQYRFMVFNNADTPVQVGEKTTYSEMMLELGSQASSYASYFTPIELAKIGNYQDRIYKTNGKWYIEKKVGKVASDDFNNSIAISGGGMRYYTPNDYGGESAPQQVLTMSSHFIGCSHADRAVALNTTYVNGNIGVSMDTTMTLNQFKTWFADNSVALYYALATPITTEITNSELVGQLEAILQAYLYTGTNNVSNNTASPNLAGQMNIGYKLIFSEETVLIEPTAVRLTLTDGGIINVCGCRQNVQLTMRETIQ